MIKIEERRAEKLSGLTSLFISFDYKDEIVAFLKQNLDIYTYNKKTKEWETTILELSKLLDSLCFYDDISFSLLNPNEHKESSKVDLEELKLKSSLYKHQIDAINYGINHDKWLLLDDQGLGKSLEIIAIAKWLKENRKIKHCLIVCGINTLKANWKKEISRHSNLSYRVIGEKISSKGNISYASIPERAEEIKNGIKEFFLITNIESLRSEQVVSALNSQNIEMIVCDEIHKVNVGSAQASGFLKLKSTYKIAATGTIIVNSPLSAFTSLKWLGVEKSNLTNFKKEYCIFGGFGGYEIVGYKNLDILKSELDSCSLRRTKKEVLKDLPPKTIIKEYISLSDEHRKFYESVKEAIRDDRMKVKLDANNILALTTRLRQATACPSILTTENIISSKLERCVDLVEQIVSSGNKVVVFSTFKEPVYKLKDMLKKYNPLIGTGDLKDEEVSKNIDKFQGNEKYKIFIGTTSKCGTGITLTAASYMIFIDTPFTSSSYVQAQDRIYRIGTTNPVFIYNLICEQTIDERVADIIDTKGAMSDYLVDDVLSNDALRILKNYILDI